MPRYFIDTDDGSLFVSDDEGQDYADVRAARDMAHKTLPDMAQQRLPDGEHRTFTASVRDASGSIHYVATLTLAGAWRIPPVR